MKIDEFITKSDLVITKISETAAQPITRVEYRTTDEFYCEAKFCVLAKSEVESDFDAFVKLWSYSIHSDEEWSPSETNLKNARSIYMHHMLAQLETYQFKMLTSRSVHAHISIVEEIIDWIDANRTYDEVNRAGVYVDGESIESCTTLQDLNIFDVVSGIGFRLDWNWKEVMYQTPIAYIYFEWGTGC